MSIGNGSGRMGVWAPMIQYGFAGLSVLLLCMICWMLNQSDERFDKLLDMQRDTTEVIERNTAAIVELSRAVHGKL